MTAGNDLSCSDDALERDRVQGAAEPCEACPLEATQIIHGAHLCDRCARESRRMEREQ